MADREPRKLVIATGNRKKAGEIKAILGTGMRREILCLGDFPPLPEPEETGTTFAENARLKAGYYSGRLGMAVLAEDSGLAVDCLGGRPGVFSARYAGEGKDDGANIERLLSEMKRVPPEKRGASFVSVACLAGPGLPARPFEGRCRGVISAAPRGSGGFGYDPVFLVPAAGKTFAEMSPGEKNRLSHRRQALEKVRLFLESGAAAADGF